MSLTRTEINLRRLLNKCELMIKSKQKDDMRFPKYIESLEDMLKILHQTPEAITTECVNDYYRRICNLKVTLGLDNASDLSFDESSNKLKNETTIMNKLSARDELLGLKKRDVKKKETGAENLDELIDYHQNMQQKIADDMLLLTKSLKEQSKLANKIIKKDTEVASRSSQLTEDNFSKLKVESNKLTEHSKRAWKCWMWIMLLIVLVVFINMVLFMKIMKKKY